MSLSFFCSVLEQLSATGKLLATASVMSGRWSWRRKECWLMVGLRCAAVGAAAGGQICRRCWRKKVAKPPNPSWEGAAVVFNREREASAEEESLLVVGEEAGSGIVWGEWKKRKNS